MGHWTDFEFIFEIFQSSFYVWKCTETQTLAGCQSQYWMQNIPEKKIGPFFGCFLGTISSLLSGALFFFGIKIFQNLFGHKAFGYFLGNFQLYLGIFVFFPPKFRISCRENFSVSRPKPALVGQGDGQVVIKTVIYFAFYKKYWNE